jgi:hypothetical protein
MLGWQLVCAIVLGCVLPGLVEGQDAARSADPLAVLVAQFDSSWNRKDTWPSAVGWRLDISTSPRWAP